MKAAIYRRYGPPDVVQLEGVAKPVPKDNEILVRVHATTVCATDSRVRKADYFIFRLFIGLSKPRKSVIAGVEFSGRVVQVGKDVSRFKVGDHVFGCLLILSLGPQAFWEAPENAPGRAPVSAPAQVENRRKEH